MKIQLTRTAYVETDDILGLEISGLGADGCKETLFFSKEEARMLYEALRQLDFAGELED
jgi:hypothetical protein